MKMKTEGIYIDPASRSPLSVNADELQEQEVWRGYLRSKEGVDYVINDGIPDLTYPCQLHSRDEHARDFYEGRVEAYEENLYLTFQIQGVNEEAIRNSMIDSLNLKPECRVLEIACGTGRDSRLIAKRLGPNGRLFLQDISAGMVNFCRSRLGSVSVPTEYSVGNACYLPFPDRYFDAVYSFGALGEFSDIRRSLSEMVRVTKLGGRIGVGDESMPPWLRETKFAKILTTTNPQFMADIPLKDIPIDARNVNLRWIIGGVFYFLDFTVGNGEPTAEFDLEIPGPRGGTLRTRYEGQLEGVTPETKLLVQKVIAQKNISMHKWLDAVVRDAVKRELMT